MRLHPPRRAVAAALIPFLLATLPAVAADTLDSVEQAALHWARLRSETARVESDWSWEREVLASTRLALEERVKLLEEKRTLLETRGKTDRTEIAELKKRTDDGAAALAEVEQKLGTLADGIIALRSSLPPRLSQALELPFRSLADPSQTFAQRAQHLSSILNRCALFNQSITVSEEVVTIPGTEDQRMLEVIYWGLSHAYALDRSRNQAYLGTTSETGWKWQEASGMAAAVDAVIRIQGGKLDPRLVELPLHAGPHTAETSKSTSSRP